MRVSIERTQPEEDVLNSIENILSSSIPWSNVFNSICSKPHDLAAQILYKYVDTNVGDKRIFPGIGFMEQSVIETIGKMLKLQHAAGVVTSGGTEANLLALYAARRKLDGNTLCNEVIVSPQIHYSINKAAALMGLRIRNGTLHNDGTLDPDSVRSLLSDRTLAVISTAGSSELGIIDNTSKIANVLSEHKCWLHVDAATGGFILPFRVRIAEKHKFDFSIERVDSITVDPHKYGFAPIPSGALCIRNKEDFERIDFPSFFADSVTHRTILGTRSGGAIAATYGILQHLGHEGFSAATRRLDSLLELTTGKLIQMGYDLLSRPTLPIFGVRIPNAITVSRKLETMGWIVSVSKTYSDVLRVVLHHHHDETSINNFLDQLARVSPPAEMETRMPCNYIV